MPSWLCPGPLEVGLRGPIPAASCALHQSGAGEGKLGSPLAPGVAPRAAPGWRPRRSRPLQCCLGDQGPTLCSCSLWCGCQLLTPSPSAPRIPKAWLSYLGDGSAGPSKDGVAKRTRPRPGPAGVNLHPPWTRWARPPPLSCGSSAVPTPHVGLLLPCPGDAGRALGLAPSPACHLTHSLWLPGAELRPGGWGGARQPQPLQPGSSRVGAPARLPPSQSWPAEPVRQPPLYPLLGPAAF